MHKMKWNDLIKPYRLGCPNDKCGNNPNRSEFERDYDRIIFSTDFRRLNGKTQVFPFPKTDNIHTRLTHSLETVSVGRSLGMIVGNRLNKNNDKIHGEEIAAVLSAACLTHDLGNPPFGHSGEEAIIHFFNSEKGKEIIDLLNEEEKEDFLNFEGNAMTFHILTHSNPKKTDAEGGLRLTYSTLGALTKYPRSSYINKHKGKGEEKFGIFQCDMSSFKELASELNIIKKEEESWYRHPLVFLTEAADDICYRIMDLEDGYKHNIISYDEISNLFKRIIQAPSGKSNFNSIDRINDENEKIGYLRAKVITSLVNQVAEKFIEKEQKILKGKFDDQLINNIESKDEMKEINKLSDKIYNQKEVLQIEAAGFKVLPGLLHNFIMAIKDDKNRKYKKIKNLIPDEYILDYEKKPYEAIMSITEYVAGMTDNFAVDLYRNLSGIELPNY